MFVATVQARSWEQRSFSCTPPPSRARPGTVDQDVISKPQFFFSILTLFLPSALTAVFDMGVVPYLDDALCVSAGYKEASHHLFSFFPFHEEFGVAILRARDDRHSGDPVRVCFDHPYCCCRGLFFLNLVTRASAPSETGVVLIWNKQRLHAWETNVDGIIEEILCMRFQPIQMGVSVLKTKKNRFLFGGGSLPEVEGYL